MVKPLRLAQNFYARDAREVAQALLGKHLRHAQVVLRITEVEAYVWPDDSANHCSVGRTKRNAAMWGPAGHAYVYVCYGMHHMLNVVTNQVGEGAAVLIRSAEPIAGLAQIHKRRRGLQGPVLLTGPGKVAAALGIDGSFNGQPLFMPGGLELLDGASPSGMRVGPRIGIDSARYKDRRAPWRFAVADSPWVSYPKQLRCVKSPTRT